MYEVFAFKALKYFIGILLFIIFVELTLKDCIAINIEKCFKILQNT